MDYIDRAIGVSVGLDDATVPCRPGKLEPEGQDEMVLCLCPACASQFYNSPEHIIHRIGPETENKDYCTYCTVRMGNTYRVIHKKKRLGDDRV